MAAGQDNFSSAVVKSHQLRFPPAHLDGTRLQQHSEHLLTIDPHVRLSRRFECLDRNSHWSLIPSFNLMFLSSKEFRKIRSSGKCLDTTRFGERSLLKVVKETNMNHTRSQPRTFK